MKNQLVDKKFFGRDQLPLVLLLSLYTVLLCTRINFDFWNDELYTLEHFVFVPISKTLTDYHVPNNHVLFNLIHNIYLKCLGISSMYEVMDTPYILRFPSLLLAITTALYIYKIGNQFFSRNIGLIAILILTTTIPFYNFALQIRGYGMSTMFGVLLVFHILKHLNSANKKQLVLIAVFSFFLIYTIPSNLYLVLGILIFLFIKWIIDVKTYGFKNSMKSSNTYVLTTLAVCSGIIVSFIAYSVIFIEVFNNPYLKPHESFLFSQLSFYVPTVLHDVISFRYFIILVALIGIVWAIIKKQQLTPLFLCFIIITTPFLMFYIRGDNAPLRTFVPYIPYYVLLFAVGIGLFAQMLLKTKKKQLIFFSVATLYCFWAYNRESHINSRQIKNDILNATRTKAYFYTNYFSYHYQPLKDIKNFRINYYDYKIPVVIQGCEPHGARHYLDKFEIFHFNETHIDSLRMHHDSIYVITNHFKNCPQTKEFISEKIDTTNTYHNTVLCRRNYGEIEKYRAYFSKLNNLSSPYQFYFTNEKLHRWGKSTGLKAKLSNEINPPLVKEIICGSSESCFLVSDNEAETWQAIGRVLGTGDELSHWYQKKDINILEIIPPAPSPLLIHKTSIKSNKVEYLTNSHEYSATLNTTRNDLKKHLVFTFFSDLTKDQELIAVVSGDGNDKDKFWKGIKIESEQVSNDSLKFYTVHFDIPEGQNPEQRINAYLWNSRKSSFRIKNLTIYMVDNIKFDKILDHENDKTLVF